MGEKLLFWFNEFYFIFIINDVFIFRFYGLIKICYLGLVCVCCVNWN